MVMARPTLLYASPLPPARSGISIYSEFLILALVEYFDVTLYVQANDLPQGRLSRLPILIHERDAGRRLDFDHRLYHIGNNPRYHSHIYEACLEHPGWVVLHEFVLYFLLAGLYRDRPDFYRRMFRIGGANAIAEIKQMVKRGQDLLTYRHPERVPSNAELLKSGNRIVVHSEYTRRLAQEAAPEARIYRSQLIPPEAVPSSRSRADVLASVGIPEEAIVVASFGFVAHTKLNDVAARAVERVAACKSAPLYYLMVGEGDYVDSYLGRRIKITCYVNEQQFDDYLAHCDLVLNLRHPVMGETSGALLRALGCARPCIVTDLGWFSELPDDVVLKIRASDPGMIEEYLVEALKLYLEHPLPFLKMGQQGASYVRTNHSPLTIAKAYHRLLTTEADGWASPYSAVSSSGTGLRREDQPA
jgi:glycosyltransferase involved in cell wall biosynthesis